MILDDEVAQQSERGFALQRVLGEQPQEHGVSAGRCRQPVAQCRAEREVAVQRAHVEEDRRVQERFCVGRPQPRAERGLPFDERQAPARIARHDLAVAQRESALRERFVHAAREADEGTSHGLDVPVDGRMKHEAVVLVRRECLLVAALRSEGEPAVAVTSDPAIVGDELECADRHEIVQRRDHPRQLLGRHRLLPEVARQFAHLAGGAGQCCQIGRVPDGGRDRGHAEAREREEIAVGDAAGRASVDHHHDVPESAFRHGQRGFVRHHVTRQAHRCRRHDRIHRTVDARVAQDHAVAQIAQREDADGVACIVRHDCGVGASETHPLEDGPQRFAGRADHVVCRQDVAERSLERLRTVAGGVDALRPA